MLNQSLPDILSRDHPASLVNKAEFPSDYDEIAICVPGPVWGGKFVREDLKGIVPTNLYSELRQRTDKPVHLYKDADAWAVGAVSYSREEGKSLDLPAIILVFGTGVGCSIASGSETFLSVEISNWPFNFPKLEKAAGKGGTQSWEVHQILGKRFFAWVESDRKNWDHDRIRAEFSKRVVALIQDMSGRLSNRAGRLESVIVGGGNAKFVSERTLEKECGLRVRSLWTERIGTDPDIIPLLGLQQLANSKLTMVEEF